MFDCHTHTHNSPDSKQTLQELCDTALSLGLAGVAITDHAHMSPAQARFFGAFDNEKNIRGSIADARAAKEAYEGRLKVLCGIEMGEYRYDKPAADRLLGLTDYDIILGAIHYVEGTKWNLAYSKIVFDESVSDGEITDYLSLYFEEISGILDELDFDVLAHLTCPVRYINGRYGRDYDIMRFSAEIDTILKKMIRRQIALEVNTTGLGDGLDGKLCPDTPILQRYYELGGRLITLGSDAHRPVVIARGFDEALRAIRAVGFDSLYYFEKRKPQPIAL